jgi:hypothetical protein
VGDGARGEFQRPPLAAPAARGSFLGPRRRSGPANKEYTS